MISTTYPARARSRSARVALVSTALAGLGASLLVAGSAAAAKPAPTTSNAVPRPVCDGSSRPETAQQGRVPAADVTSGRAALGYTCNASLVSHVPSPAAYKVQRHVDSSGRECAFYDSTSIFPVDAVRGRDSGTFVLDMSDPAKPVRTATLTTPAMLSPHESLLVEPVNGLLVANMGNPGTAPGVVDVYDIDTDCRKPVLLSSTPMGVLGHEAGLSPDGRTYYVGSAGGRSLSAVDISDPRLPRLLWATTEYVGHGLRLREDGRVLYMADIGNAGLTLLDVGQIQDRVPQPVVRELSRITWDEVSIPQVAEPLVIDGRHYVLEVDEFARSGDPRYAGPYDPYGDPVGAARMIDVEDPTQPRVVSQVRLEVHEPANRAGEQKDDPDARQSSSGYVAHYCSVPKRVDPGIVACTMLRSGLRVFDVSDPLQPREVAYFNAPVGALSNTISSIAFAPERRELWYSDRSSGFYSVRLSPKAWPGAK